MAKRSSLVCQHLENISRDGLEKYQDVIREYVRGRHGVYALYRGTRLYYVGLATNLRMRLAHHLRDRHHDSWDRFSVYLTIGDSHLRELESLILRIVRPKGNKQTGKLRGSDDLIRAFRRSFKERQRRELETFFGPSKKKSDAAKSGVGTEGKKPVLAKYSGGRTIKLRRVYKGVTYKAHVRPDGTVRMKGVTYMSPSMAGQAICKHAVNGWEFWRYERAPGDWVKLEKLRR